jgi:hypothetical protein
LNWFSLPPSLPLSLSIYLSLYLLNDVKVFNVRDILEDIVPDILCSEIIDNKMLLGTDQGLYIFDLNQPPPPSNYYSSLLFSLSRVLFFLFSSFSLCFLFRR